MSDYQLPALASETEFEVFVTELCRDQYGSSFQIFGRKGQTQSGIDGIATNEENKLVVHQCKNKRLNRQDKDIVKELLSALDDDVASFNQQFIIEHKFSVECFIFANTFKNEAALQTRAAQLTTKYGFKVIIWSWDYMASEAMDNQRILNKYFAKLIRVNGKVIESKNYIDDLTTIVKEHYTSHSFKQMIGLSTSVDRPSPGLFDKVIVNHPCSKVSSNYPQPGSNLPRDLMECFSNNNCSKKLILGKAGSGKTTFLKSICSNWSEKGLVYPFKVILYVSLRDWNDELSFAANILNFYYDFDNATNASFENEYQLLKENSKDILFVFDGVDEFDLKDNGLFLSKVLKFSNVIFTSRPYDINPNKLNVDKTYEITGFSTAGVLSYIDELLPTSKAIKLKGLLQKEVTLFELAHTPIVLEVMCLIFESSHEELSIEFTNLTVLYQYLLDRLLSDYCALKGLNTVEENEIGVINVLSKLAFDSLIENKTSIEVSKTVEGREFFRDCLLRTGLLKSKLERPSIYKDHYSFYHLTFQEYFAALYVSSLDMKEISKIISTYKLHSRFNAMFKFLTGMCKDKEVIFNGLDSGYEDVIGSYSLSLRFDCCNEVINSEERNRYLPRLHSSKVFAYGIHNKLSLIPLISKIRDEKTLIDLYSKFGYEMSKVVCFQQLILHTEKAKELIADLMSADTSVLLREELLLKAMSLNIISPIIDCGFDIKSFISNRIRKKPNRWYSFDFNESDNLLDGNDLVSALLHLQNYNEDYQSWVSYLMNQDDVDSVTLSGFLRLTNNMDTEESPLFDEYCERVSEDELEINEENLYTQFEKSRDKLASAEKILDYLNELSKEQVKNTKLTKSICNYILSINGQKRFEYNFIKFASRFLKRCYYVEIDEYLCGCISSIQLGAAEYTDKELMYIVEHLSLVEFKSPKLKHIIFSFLNNDSIAFGNKIDVAKCLFITGSREPSVMKTLLRLISSTEKHWRKGIQEIMKREIIPLLNGFSVNNDHEVLEPNRVYCNSENMELSVTSIFGFIRQLPYFLEDIDFIKLVVNTFISNNKPLYIDDNRLTSTENGKEVSINISNERLKYFKEKVNEILIPSI